MAIQEDNVLDPNNKARWGFAGTQGSITVGPQTVGETGGVETARTPLDEQGGRGNGGGEDVTELRERLAAALRSSDSVAQAAADEQQALRDQLGDLQAQLDAANAKLAGTGGPADDPRDDLTKDEIKAQLDAKGVSYSSTANKPELLDLLKAQPVIQE